jgi:hypothetical protein
MTYPVSDRIVNILQQACQKLRSREYTDRGNLCIALGDQNYHGIWIDSEFDYQFIDQHLSKFGDLNTNDKQHIIIYQTEEDWFSSDQHAEIRNAIKNHPNWTEHSFVITNSIKDKQKTLAKGINTVCRPGLLDLISYQPYDCNLINFNNITHHTGVCWQRYNIHRRKIWELLAKHRQKIIVAKVSQDWMHNQFRNKLVLNNSKQDVVPVDEVELNAPYQSIETDFWWANHVAFGTVIETHWRSNGSTGYAPTTSEKIYRNMHLLRPAVVCGGHNTRDYLLALGFDTWDWFVDWSFDSEPDDELRFQGYLNEIERLLNISLEELIALINQHKDKLLHNRDKLFWLINNYDTIDI